MNSSRRKHRNWKLTVAMGLRGNGCSTQTQVSARKLAAAAWWNFSLSAHAAASHPYYSPSPYSIFQLANGKNLKIMPPRYHNSGGNKVTKGQLRRPITILRLRSRNGLRRELESSTRCLKEATKRNPDLIEEFNEFTRINSRKQLLEDRKFVADDRDFGVNVVLEELLQAQMSINKLNAAQKSVMITVERFLQNLEEEKVFWKCREHQKLEATIDDLEHKLVIERKGRRKMVTQNKKLAHELAKAELSTKQFMTKYNIQEKEIKILREVCKEFAMQIREEKARFYELERNHMITCKEVEQMMQIIDQWRE